MRSVLLFFLFPLFLCSCSLKENKTATSLNDDKEETVNHDETTQQDSYQMIYVYEDDTFKQTLKVSFLNEEEIDFLFISENKIKKQKESIQGIAKNEYLGFGSVELDEDDDGNAYPVDEYIYHGNCWLAFRINMEDKSTVRIKVADCEEENPNCPFYSIGLLLRQ